MKEVFTILPDPHDSIVFPGPGMKSNVYSMRFRMLNSRFFSYFSRLRFNSLKFFAPQGEILQGVILRKFSKIHRI
jgi:hypothetical protein